MRTEKFVFLNKKSIYYTFLTLFLLWIFHEGWNHIFSQSKSRKGHMIKEKKKCLTVDHIRSDDGFPESMWYSLINWNF